MMMTKMRTYRDNRYHACTSPSKVSPTDTLPPSLPTPSCLKPHPPHADCHTYQLRAYIYQARDMYASDKSGLSDPYAVMSFTRYSTRTRVVKESVCPTWDQTLLINQIRIFGTPQSVLDSPPPVVLELFDKDIVVSVHIKHFPPKSGNKWLHFFSLSRVPTSFSVPVWPILLCVCHWTRLVPCWTGFPSRATTSTPGSSWPDLS